ncbi:MAG: AAA family ATPase [Flavobacteriaceae bacterium]
MIDSLKIKNFQSHSETSLDFSPGVNVIIGDTDSGKTSILRAVGWLLNNRPRGSSFVRKGKKSCSVSIRTSRGLIERERKSSFNGYRVKSDSIDASFTEVGTTVPSEILSVLRLGDINTQSQLSSHFLIGMSDGYISKQLAEFLGFDFADKLSLLVKSGGTQASKEVSKFSDEAKDLQSKLSSIESKLAAKEDLIKVKNLYKNLESCFMGASTLEALISSYRRSSHQLKRSNLLLAALSDVDLLIDKFNKLDLVVKDFKVYSNAFAKLSSAKKNLLLSEKNFGAISINSNIEKNLLSLESVSLEVKEISKIIATASIYSVKLSKSKHDLDKSCVLLDDAFSSLEAAVDGLTYCSECLRELSEDDRFRAKGLVG